MDNICDTSPISAMLGGHDIEEMVAVTAPQRGSPFTRADLVVGRRADFTTTAPFPVTLRPSQLLD